MQPRVFVVMPFGQKEVDTKEGKRDFDYDALYTRLLQPALVAAGCEPFRADQESAAGDIRTDMFFELVTADAILAEVTSGNANVFYELGVRHAATPRGAFMIHGGWSDFRPFDLGPDRTFSYKGQLFLGATEPDARQLQPEVDRLATTLRNALARDSTTIGSPVYNNLPGLQPVDWSNIQTARFRYFSGILEDWKRRVKIARRNGYPGDILTLAEDAPTRYHREEVLGEAARALADLCRFEIAESVLREILEISPGNSEARCALGMALGRCGRMAQAQEEFQRALQMRADDSEARTKLARIYKDIWRSRWEAKPAISDRQTEAMNQWAPAVEAIKNYYAAISRHPESYFAGINVLVLSALLRHVASVTKDDPSSFPAVDPGQLTAIVSFSARRALDKPDERIWAAATLGILAILAGNAAEARRWMREVAGSPDFTALNRQSILQDLSLMKGLEYQPEAVAAVVGFFSSDSSYREYRRVFVFSGHMIDTPGRTPPRFPPEKEGAVRQALAVQLDNWGLGEGDLALSGAAQGGDILFAELCRERKAHVRLMLAEPPEVYMRESVRRVESSWADRFLALNATSEVRVQTVELGPPPGSVSPHARNNLWLLNTARVEATPDRLYALMVWNGEKAPGLYGTSHFAERAEQLLGGRFRTVNPMEL